MNRGTALNPKGPFVGTSALEGKRFVYEIITSLKPQTGLDIGCGSGTYARLFPELEWTGIEVWENYVKRFSLDRLYERFILADVRSWDPDANYDVGIAGDILEHMTEDEAIRVFGKLKSCCENVIVSIPVVNYPQEEIGGNPYERHIVDNWNVDRVIAAFGEPYWHGVEHPIGVFMWKGQ